MPKQKPSLLKESRRLLAEENKGIHTFPKGISSKENVKAKLASYDVTVQYVGESPRKIYNKST